MSNPIMPIPPLPGEEPDTVPTREVDGEHILDPDIAAGDVDSAEADRLAAESGTDDDDDRLGSREA